MLVPVNHVGTYDASETWLHVTLCSTSYNISFGGLERLHPFDPCKYSKVMKSLRQQGLVDEVGATPLWTMELAAWLPMSIFHRAWLQVWEPCEVPEEALKAVHSKEYLARLHSSPRVVARVVELPPLAILPMCLTDRFLLKKLRIQAAGTILAAGLAVRDGWAINVGGGTHHAQKREIPMHAHFSSEISRSRIKPS